MRNLGPQGTVDRRGRRCRRRRELAMNSTAGTHGFVERRVVGKGPRRPEESAHDEVDGDGAAHTADGGDERRERLRGRVERAAGETRFGDFLGGDAKEEDHEHVVDQIVDRERVAEEGGARPEANRVGPVPTTLSYES
jgi:hypothetical protein